MATHMGRPLSRACTEFITTELEEKRLAHAEDIWALARARGLTKSQLPAFAEHVRRIRGELYEEEEQEQEAAERKAHEEDAEPAEGDGAKHPGPGVDLDVEPPFGFPFTSEAEIVEPMIVSVSRPGVGNLDAVFYPDRVQITATIQTGEDGQAVFEQLSQMIFRANNPRRGETTG